MRALRVSLKHFFYPRHDIKPRTVGACNRTKYLQGTAIPYPNITHYFLNYYHLKFLICRIFQHNPPDRSKTSIPAEYGYTNFSVAFLCMRFLNWINRINIYFSSKFSVKKFEQNGQIKFNVTLYANKTFLWLSYLEESFFHNIYLIIAQYTKGCKQVYHLNGRSDKIQRDETIFSSYLTHIVYTTLSVIFL